MKLKIALQRKMFFKQNKHLVVLLYFLFYCLFQHISLPKFTCCFGGFVWTEGSTVCDRESPTDQGYRRHSVPK